VVYCESLATVTEGVAVDTIGPDNGHVTEENFMPDLSLIAYFPETYHGFSGRRWSLVGWTPADEGWSGVLTTGRCHDG
jgi:hypothetical protein